MHDLGTMWGIQGEKGFHVFTATTAHKGNTPFPPEDEPLYLNESVRGIKDTEIMLKQAVSDGSEVAWGSSLGPVLSGLPGGMAPLPCQGAAVSSPLNWENNIPLIGGENEIRCIKCLGCGSTCCQLVSFSCCFMKGSGDDGISTLHLPEWHDFNNWRYQLCWGCGATGTHSLLM